MLKPVLFTLICVISVFKLHAQDEHSFQWRYESELGAPMIQQDVLPLEDRGYVCSGLMESPVGSAFYYPYICRVDCQGKVVWAKVFNQGTESANNTSGRVLQISETDFVLVGNVGFFFTTPYNDIFMARVTGEGNVVWTRRIGGGTNNQDVAQSAIVTSDGNIVVAGQTGSFGTDAGSNNTYTDQYFMKVSPAGNILWTRTVGNKNAVDRSFDIIELPDQSLVAAGSYLHTGTFFANLVKMDKNGTVLWHKVFGESTAPQANHAYGVMATSDGGLLVTGSSTNLQTNFQGYSDFLIIKTDANGEVEWTRVVTGGGPDSFENASNAVEKPNGDLAIMCATNSFPTVGFVGNKYAVLTLTATGGLVDLKTYNLGSSHYPRFRAHPQEGSFLIEGFTNWTGYGGNGNRFDPLLINLDANFKVTCNYSDFTGFTSLYNPAFDIDNAPGTLGVGGTIVNDLAEASDFGLKQNVICEFRPYESCSVFSDTEEQLEPGAEFAVFPNPARAGAPVSLRWSNAQVEQITIIDAIGRVMGQYFPVPGMDNLEWRAATPGIYWVTLQGDGLRRVEKVVVH
ncbi:MAG: T9SS type A sorting domain-containing protein [Chitinophagales bacterium]|nr:T9SS type A sorting domain-containing protein [Chitinophagales bacterium]